MRPDDGRWEEGLGTKGEKQLNKSVGLIITRLHLL